MRILYLILGFITLFLGLIGIVLPVLPTVPFLLVTIFCFSKGSTRFYNWFIGTKIYKNHLQEFVETRSMPLKKKIIILLSVTALLLVVLFTINSPHAKIAIVVVLIVKYWYFIFKIKNS